MLVFISQLPVLVAMGAQKEVISTLAKQTNALKLTIPTADTPTLEAEIDLLVYGLTEEEVALVDGGLIALKTLEDVRPSGVPPDYKSGRAGFFRDG